ncbi:MAG TPA: hypothetical protein VFQ76_16440 [Longimicrobiaceae bacterium]|nr:hypothetical protein [Longimicrobiaceae bacterium]
MSDGLFHVIYLRSGPLLVSRKPYADWREIQDEFDEDFMTSLGPWTVEEVVGFFEQQYGPDGARWPLGAADVEAFAASDREVMSTDEA